MSEYRDFCHFRCNQCEFLSFTSDDVDYSANESLFWVFYETGRPFYGLIFHRSDINGLAFAIKCRGCDRDLGVTFSGLRRIFIFKNAVNRHLIMRYVDNLTSLRFFSTDSEDCVLCDGISSTTEI